MKYESECCDCDLPCVREACRYYSVPHNYCDECGNEDQLYHWNTRQLCINCIEILLNLSNFDV